MAPTMLAAARSPNGLSPAELTNFSVPARHNPRLQALVERLNADDELRQLWRCANVNAVERLGLGDSGEVHARIVANAALKLLRLLRDAGEVPGLTDHHRLPTDEAELVVVLAAALHDLDLAAAPASGSPALAALKARELLAGLYPVRERTIVLAETLLAISALSAHAPCLTLEASVLRLADALDLTKGRARLPLTTAAGTALVVDEVLIQKYRQPPVRVVIGLNAPDSVSQLETALHAQLPPGLLAGRVEIVARLGADTHSPLVPLRAWTD